jgi:hypothetical protein
LLILRPLRAPLMAALFVAASAWNVAHADSAIGNQVIGNQVTQSSVEMNTLRSSGEPTPEAAPTSEFNQLLQDLSPLPVLALGLLGLFWIRRHTTEL